MTLCPNNKTMVTDFGESYAVVKWSDLQVSDNSGQSLNVTCSTESGSQFGIGETGIICQAVDPSGNQAMCAFTVKIQGNDNSFCFFE